MLIKFNWFASDWRQLIHVAAIDCAEERNLPICVHYNIEGYPSVKVCAIKYLNVAGTWSIDHVYILITPICFSLEQFFNASAPISNLGETYIGMLYEKWFVSINMLNLKKTVYFTPKYSYIVFLIKLYYYVNDKDSIFHCITFLLCIV